MQHSGGCFEKPSLQEVDLFKWESESKSVFSKYWDFSGEQTVEAADVWLLTSVEAEQG